MILRSQKRSQLAMAISLILVSPLSYAASFTITNGQIETAQQTLNDNETGIVEAGGRLDIAAADGIAIGANGINNIVNNAGSITTAGMFSPSILASGDNAIISNSGSITTSGDVSSGIEMGGQNAIITNSGSITTSGNGAYGIILDGSSDSTITNSGSITVSGDAAGIISVGGANVTINNSGSVIVSADDAFGIITGGANVTINNSGSVIASGDNAYGILSEGVDGIINNSGSVTATGVGSYAIFGNSSGGGSTTLNLLPGSQIIGRIALDGATDTVNIHGGSISANLTFEQAAVINLFSAGVVNGNNVVTVDLTGESTRSVALSSLSSTIHNVVSSRMAHNAPLKPVQVAALTLSPDMAFQQRQPVAWAQLFGGTFDRDAESNALGYDHDHIGFTLGYEWDMDASRVGLMGGYAKTDTETQLNSFKSDANNYYIGAYSHLNFDSANLTLSLLGGYSDHDNDRIVVDNLIGIETAESDFDSYFISPSITLSSAYSVADRLELRPSASINYSVAWLDGYREKGTTNSNLKVDDRTIQVLTAKLQLAAAYRFDQASEFEFRVGVNARNSHDDDIDVSMAGNSFKFNNVGDDNVSGGFVGANLRVATQNNLSLVADVEFGGDGDEHYASGRVSLEYSF